MSDDAPKSAPAAPAEADSAELVALAARATDLINPLEREAPIPGPPAPAPPVNKLHEWAVAAALMLVIAGALLWSVWFFRSGGAL